MLFLKKLFDFSKPKFFNLDYIDIVVEDKMLFLVSWRSKRYYKVNISPLKKTYYDYETAVILKVPAGTTELRITLHSFWRKSRYRILLKKVKLDKEMARQLILRFKPMKMLRLETPAINSVYTFPDINLPAIVLHKHGLRINKPVLFINTDSLSYTNKPNYYE